VGSLGGLADPLTDNENHFQQEIGIERAVFGGTSLEPCDTNRPVSSLHGSGGHPPRAM
jgi:hypothetical protein